MTATALTPPAFVRLMNFFFRRLGFFVADHDKMVMVVVLIFTIISSAKIAFTRQEDDIKTGYTPFGARSRDEIQAYNDYFAASGDPVSVFVFVTAKDGGSMGRYEYLKETVDVMDYIGVNITHRGSNFYTMCSDFCQINEPIRQYYNGMALQHQGSNFVENRFQLTFPFMEVLGKELDLSPSFFGVHANESTQSIDYMKTVMMQFRANPPENWKRDDVAEYERTISNYYHKKYNSSIINVYALSLTYTGDEVVRTGLTIFPYLAVGFGIMSIFSIITVFYSSTQMGQWTYHKISLALFGCVCPLLATSSALGFMFWFGFRFGTILCVTPFLVLAIGVDDAYLMIHSWMRIVSDEPTLTKRERVSQMLVDVGPSITITSLTNFLAFIVGIYTPTPEIQLFCIGNAVAIIVDYFYTITMYAALMSMIGQAEMRVEHKKSEVQWNGSDRFLHLLDDYSQWLSSKFTACLLFACMCVYWYVSIVGAMDIKIILSPDKLVLSDSPLLTLNDLRDNYVLPNYTTVNIFVQKPGDLSNPAHLERVNDLIGTYESYPECLGPKFSHYFVREYLSFQEMEGDEELAMEEEEQENSENKTSALALPNKFSKNAMDGFLKWPEFKHWNGFVKFDENGTISKFFAMVAYHGENLGDFQMRKRMLRRWRQTADSFADLKVSVFDDYSPFVDQLDEILPATISTSACTLLCMMIVCFLFMYNIFTVMVATISITSICIGVFGFLSYWGIDLDPISMATTIMSIGFSVDFPAHITFHYFREGIEEPDSPPSKRVAKSLAAIGFPLLQCGISTIIFVLCLLFVKTYMSEVFVKTMVLVVSLGLVHGLVIVPAFLCALTGIYKAIFTKSLKESQSFSSLAKVFGWKLTPSSSDGRIDVPPIQPPKQSV